MMSKEQFNRELGYESAMAVARAMLKSGIVDKKDYCKIDTMLQRKYRPIIGSLHPANIPKLT